ncbi:hypothetical protein H3C61_01135 [Candidatus Gracilibacteria bacterium]|nr:hypothetical protein [Candidatus Gracilibacteria bacterium]
MENIKENNLSSIEDKLNKLDQKLEKLNNENYKFSYEKDNNGLFYPKINGEKLEIPFENGKDLIEALVFLEYLMKFYLSLGNKGKLYVKEDIWTKGELVPALDIYVDDNNILIPDTMFLRAETITKKFKIIDSRDKMIAGEIADFLNKVLNISK